MLSTSDDEHPFTYHETGKKINKYMVAIALPQFGWPASALNLFWGILSWKRKTENVLVDSGLPYTILR